MSLELTMPFAVVSPMRTLIWIITSFVLTPSLTFKIDTTTLCAFVTPVRLTVNVEPSTLELATLALPLKTLAPLNVTGAAKETTIW